MACLKEEKEVSVVMANLDVRKTSIRNYDALTLANSYLLIYSRIYQVNERRAFNLTATIGMRNVSKIDSLYILEADHYNTKGEIMRNFIDSPVFIAPLETVEIL